MRNPQANIFMSRRNATGKGVMFNPQVLVSRQIQRLDQKFDLHSFSNYRVILIHLTLSVTLVSQVLSIETMKKLFQSHRISFVLFWLLLHNEHFNYCLSFFAKIMRHCEILFK